MKRHVKHTSSTAFTLVELLITLTLIATLTAAAMPTLAVAFDDLKLSAVARQIALDLHYTRHLAVKTGKQHRLQFDSTYGSYTISKNDGDWTVCTNPITKKAWTYSFADSRGGGVTILLTNFGDKTISFDRYGSANAAGQLVLSLGSSKRTIRITRLTGRTSVE